MKLKINTELNISEDKKTVVERFGITKEEVANHIEFYFNHETLTGYSDIIIELLNDNRLDIICTLATAYLKQADESVQPPDDVECPDCDGTGISCINVDGEDIREMCESSGPCNRCKGFGRIDT